MEFGFKLPFLSHKYYYGYYYMYICLMAFFPGQPG